MWILKQFTTEQARNTWIELNSSRYTYYKITTADGIYLDVKRIK